MTTWTVKAPYTPVVYGESRDRIRSRRSGNRDSLDFFADAHIGLNSDLDYLNAAFSFRIQNLDYMTPAQLDQLVFQWQNYLARAKTNKEHFANGLDHIQKEEAMNDVVITPEGQVLVTTTDDEGASSIQLVSPEEYITNRLDGVTYNELAYMRENNPNFSMNNGYKLIQWMGQARGVNKIIKDLQDKIVAYKQDAVKLGTPEGIELAAGLELITTGQLSTQIKSALGVDYENGQITSDYLMNYAADHLLSSLNQHEQLILDTRAKEQGTNIYQLLGGMLDLYTSKEQVYTQTQNLRGNKTGKTGGTGSEKSGKQDPLSWAAAFAAGEGGGKAGLFEIAPANQRGSGVAMRVPGRAWPNAMKQNGNVITAGPMSELLGHDSQLTGLVDKANAQIGDQIIDLTNMPGWEGLIWYNGGELIRGYLPVFESPFDRTLQIDFAMINQLDELHAAMVDGMPMEQRERLVKEFGLTDAVKWDSEMKQYVFVPGGLRQMKEYVWTKVTTNDQMIGAGNEFVDRLPRSEGKVWDEYFDKYLHENNVKAMKPLAGNTRPKNYYQGMLFMPLKTDYSTASMYGGKGMTVDSNYNTVEYQNMMEEARKAKETISSENL